VPEQAQGSLNTNTGMILTQVPMPPGAMMPHQVPTKIST
jgi:hypothetical protein